MLNSLSTLNIVWHIPSRVPCATLLAFALLIAACNQPRPEDGGEVPQTGTFEIVARGLTFDAPDSIASGWTTMSLINQSAMTHFALVERLPNGVGIAAQQREVATVFQEGMDHLQAGDPEAAMGAFAELPEWFADVTFLGGPGLASAGRTARTTLYLHPGRYLVECYVKTEGIFHSYNPDSSLYGMVHEFVVTEDSSSAAAPEPTISVNLSSARGVEMSGDVRPGSQIFAVHFEDQIPHENFVGHDIHLARLADDTEIESLVAWMDWTQPGGLETPAPVEFVGGTNEMPAGSTAYVAVDLEPGRYAWISEVPGSDGKGLLSVFKVESDS